MSEETNTFANIKEKEQAEKESIRSKLDLMGVVYSGNAGLPRLKEQLSEALEVPEKAEVPEEMLASVQGLMDTPPGTYGELLTAAQYNRRETGKLIRVIVSCLNPNKKNWPGELFDVGNSADPARRKYIMFDTEYHVPKMILEHIKEKKCQVFIKALDNKGREIKKSKLISEYNIVKLAPLTIAELKKLGLTQTMRDSQEAA